MVYDYRHELIELLNHTTGDPESLLQTQHSLTIIVDLLNQLQPADQKSSRPASQSAKPGYKIRRGVNTPKITLNHLSQTPKADASERPQRDQAANATISKTQDPQAPKVSDNQAYLRKALANQEAENNTAADNVPPELSEVELLARDNCYPVHRLLSGAENQSSLLF